MDRFGRVLRRAERRLEAPEPRRSRILLEMAGDLEELYRAYRDRGLDEDEARRRAEEWLVPSPAALDSLRAVHLPAIDRLLDRLGGTTRGHVELGVVTFGSLAAAGSGVLGALRSGAVRAPSPGLWTVAGLLAVGLGVAAVQAYSLFVRGDRLRPGWRRELNRVAAVAVGAALAGLVSGAVRLTTTGVSPGAAGISPAAWSQLATAAGVAALGFCAALLLALLWLLLRVRGGVVARARSELREAIGPLDGERTGPGDGAELDEDDELQRETMR